MSSSPNVLTERDPNVPQSPEKTKHKGDKQDGPKSLEFHRQVLESRLKESKDQQTYVSPSDTIMSPATAKLAAFKNRHVKGVKPRTLFAKTTTNNAEAAAKQTANSAPASTEKHSDS